MKPAKPIFLAQTLSMKALPAMPASNNTKESLVMRLPVHEALPGRDYIDLTVYMLYWQ